MCLLYHNLTDPYTICGHLSVHRGGIFSNPLPPIAFWFLLLYKITRLCPLCCSKEWTMRWRKMIEYLVDCWYLSFTFVLLSAINPTVLPSGPLLPHHGNSRLIVRYHFISAIRIISICNFRRQHIDVIL